jgi:ferritin-like metal-binding protein YciE
MHMEKLRALYVAELEDLYSAEMQLVEAMPELAKHATTLELKAAFESHLEETKQHVQRLEQVFETLEVAPSGRHCTMMERFIEMSQELVDEETNGDVLDAALIARAQQVEHYEIAGYGTLKTYAVILGEVGHLRLFQQTLHEEAAADDWLTEIAHEAVDIEWTNRKRTIRRASDHEVIRLAEIDRLPLREGSRGLRGLSWHPNSEPRNG